MIGSCPYLPVTGQRLHKALAFFFPPASSAEMRKPRSTAGREILAANLTRNGAGPYNRKAGRTSPRQNLCSRAGFP